MLRSLFALVGASMIAVPRRVIAAAETLAFENPEDARLRPWTIPMGRAEGVLYLLLARRSGPPAAVGSALGLLAGFAALSPRKYLDFGLGLAYENPDEIVVRSWVLPLTRAIGLAWLLATVRRLRKRQSSPGADQT